MVNRDDRVDADMLRAREDAAMLEVELMQRVRTLALDRGWMFYHTYGSRKSTPGFPDLVMMRAPVYVYAELKRQGVRDADVPHYQWEWLAEVQAAGDPHFQAYLWRPADWPEIREVLW